MTEERKPDLVWDEHVLRDEYEQHLVEENPSGLSNDEVSRAMENYDLSFEWDELCRDLTVLMKGDTDWVCRVEGYGWRGISGQRDLTADDGEMLLQEILPKTDCMFRIFKTDDGLSVQNFHHDSPTGKEWYYLEPARDV